MQHLTEGELEAILDPLGRDRAVRVEEVTRAVEGRPRPEGEIQNPLTGRKIMNLLSAHNLALEDPVRESLIGTIATRTDGYVGSDLEGVCREAGMLAMREGATTVLERHFDEAVKKVRPTMNERSREYSPADAGGLQGRPPERGTAAGVPVISSILFQVNYTGKVYHRA